MKLFNKKETEMLEPMLTNYVKYKILNTKNNGFDQLCPKDIIKLEELMIFNIIKSLFVRNNDDDLHLRGINREIKYLIMDTFEDFKIDNLSVDSDIIYATCCDIDKIKRIGYVTIHFELDDRCVDIRIELHPSCFNRHSNYDITSITVYTTIAIKNDKVSDKLSFDYSLDYVLPRDAHDNDMYMSVINNPKYQYLTIEDVNKILGFRRKTIKSYDELYSTYDFLFYYMVKNHKETGTSHAHHACLVYDPNINVNDTNDKTYSLPLIDMETIFPDGFVNAYFGDSICHNVFNFIRQV